MAARNHKQKTYELGLKAEKMAAGYLTLKGYKVLEERYKTPYGEIDLIAQKKNLIAFIEVKARQTKEQALESITPRMKKRISQAALFYISQNDVPAMDYRFDLMAVTIPFSIDHLKNAWMMDT
jgi:putative endonuclease